MTDKKSTFDLGLEVWSRLFDHRPFVRSEVKYFVHNFELKHAEARAPDLEQPLAQTRELSGTRIGRCRELLVTSLPALQQDAELVTSQCQVALQAATLSDKARDRVAELQIEREHEWGRFLSQLERGRAELESEFAQKEADLEAYYQRTERRQLA